MRKFLSVLLAFAMMLSLGVTTLAAEDTAVGTTAVEQTYAGKTVILHSNDVHGAITGRERPMSVSPRAPMPSQ